MLADWSTPRHLSHAIKTQLKEAFLAFCSVFMAQVRLASISACLTSDRTCIMLGLGSHQLNLPAVGYLENKLQMTKLSIDEVL